MGSRSQVRQRNVRRLRGDFGEKFFDFDMGDDDVGFPLKGFVVTPFEAVAFLRRTDEGSGFERSYYEALQREPDVIFAHVEVKKLLAKIAA